MDTQRLFKSVTLKYNDKIINLEDDLEKLINNNDLSLNVKSEMLIDIITKINNIEQSLKRFNTFFKKTTENDNTDNQ